MVLSESKIMNYKSMIKKIEKRKDYVISYCQILQEFDDNDYYWSETIELAKKKYFFETSMVINWIGAKFGPKKILEIGTRTAGSLVALLYNHKLQEGLEIYCFDLWKEYSSSFFPTIAMKYLPTFIKEKFSIKKVKKNLNKLNIPYENIKFISGDSKITIPYFFKKFPDKKFDYILVDGGHDKLTASIDLENICGHFSDRGVLVFDDIGPESYKLIDVGDAFKSKHINEFNFYEKFHRKGVAWAFKK